MQRYKMKNLVKILSKTSCLAAYIFLSLALDSFPMSLVWMDEGNLIFVLRCPHIKKKDKSLCLQFKKLCLDYIQFKVRKSIADEKGCRSVFLQAMKKSPYIDYIEDTPDKKVCKFSDSFKLLIKSKLEDLKKENEGASLFVENAVPNISMSNKETSQAIENVASNGFDMEGFSMSIGETPFGNTASNGSQVLDIPIGIPNINNNFAETFMSLACYSSRSEEESVQQSPAMCNGSLQVEQSVEPAYAIQNSAAFSNGNDVPSTSWSFSMAEELAVPCLSIPKIPEDNNPSSLYVDGQSTDTVSFLNSDTSATNYGEGPSEPQFSDDTEYPPDYDPEGELLRSQGRPQKSEENKTDLRMQTNTSAFRIHSIHGAELVGNRVNMLDQVPMNSSFSTYEHYMMTIEFRP